MEIKISTKVNKDYESVYNGFTRELLEKLTPPLINFELLKFDGSRTGDDVHILLNILGLEQLWITHIVEDNHDSEEIYFVDQSSKLPFFIKYWKHKHRILKVKNGSKIIDEISYKTPFILLDYLSYPIMFLQFYYRKHIYKREFR
ncbi:MAG: hypothetical protein U0354_00920 [Candidatus Sericytochromatia bacterium]